MKYDKFFIHCNEIIKKMDTTFMNSENSKTSKPYILKLKLTDKLDL